MLQRADFNMLQTEPNMLPTDKFQGALGVASSNNSELQFLEDHRRDDTLSTGVHSKGAARFVLCYRELFLRMRVKFLNRTRRKYF